MGIKEENAVEYPASDVFMHVYRCVGCGTRHMIGASGEAGDFMILHNEQIPICSPCLSMLRKGRRALALISYRAEILNSDFRFGLVNLRAMPGNEGGGNEDARGTDAGGPAIDSRVR